MTDSRTPRYGTVDKEYGMRLATTPPDADGPVWMVNLMKYREVADYTDGRESTISGREADDLYAPLGPLAAVGAEIAFVGDVDQQLLGDSPTWDRIGVVKYPTRRSFIEMQSRPDFQRQHAHKDAGMAETIVMGCQPFDVPAWPDDAPRPDWADVRHPPTDDDRPVMVIHVLKYREAADAAVTPEQMDAYTVPLPRPPVRTGCVSTDGLRSREPSSATAARGIRCASTRSPAKRRSWPS